MWPRVSIVFRGSPVVVGGLPANVSGLPVDIGGFPVDVEQTLQTNLLGEGLPSPYPLPTAPDCSVLCARGVLAAPLTPPKKRVIQVKINIFTFFILNII